MIDLEPVIIDLEQPMKRKREEAVLRRRALELRDTVSKRLCRASVMAQMPPSHVMFMCDPTKTKRRFSFVSARLKAILRYNADNFMLKPVSSSISDEIFNIYSCPKNILVKKQKKRFLKLMLDSSKPYLLIVRNEGYLGQAQRAQNNQA
jgi:hypothetical protein